MSGYPIIDADAHVNPPPMFWDDYLPARLRGRGPHIEVGSEEEGHDWVVFEGTRKPLTILTSVAGQGSGHKLLGRASDVGEGGFLPAIRLADMDRDGVDKAVLFGGGPLGTGDEDLFVESFAAYNRWLAEFCSHAPDRLYGAAYLPMRDVRTAVKMLVEASGMGMRAVNIPAFPMSQASGTGGGGFAAQVLALTGDPDGERQYDSPEFDPFWQAAVDHDMAVTIHLGARIARPGMSRVLSHGVMSKLAMAEPIANLIFGGVFDRFPDLRFGSIESAVGWMPFVAEYMDSMYHGHALQREVELRHSPSYYMDKNIYGSFIRDRLGVELRDKVGGRNIMWSSDYPHSETSWPHSREEITRLSQGISDEDRRAILCDTAKRFYAI